MSEYLHAVRNGEIFEITLDKPKGNAVSAELSSDMGKLFAEFRDDPSLRVAILTGAGEKFFCGGWDLSSVAEGEEFIGDFGEGGFGGFIELPNLNKPVICAVNGYAIGAGFEMLLRSDFVVADESAQFWLPEAQLGVAPDVATFLLPKLLPRQKAFSILMTAQRLSAQELMDLGLVNTVVPKGEAMSAARELAHELIKAAPLSLAAIKEAIELTEGLTFAESYAALRAKEWPAFMAMLDSKDAQEGAKAFLEGRAPEWTGQ
ncbi:enoyl-CoA hydratase-related protein [Marinobacter sp. KMM 10035]|uniref:enoyl-CoA hydratase-related protein n=1 Tax=Marinobacter sp. KMM 10035 TaxID=3134034 RepID=UPI003978D605